MRCDGRCSALRRHMQCGAMTNATHCTICPGTPPILPHGNPHIPLARSTFRSPRKKTGLYPARLSLYILGVMPVLARNTL